MSKENIQAAIGRREVKSGTVSIARMYPKVKVRVQDFDDQDDDLSFSWNLTSSPGEYQADSPKCVIRVPTSLLPNQELHPTQEPKVDQKDKKSEETDKLSTRAISVTRPRAVLSSPDNDEMFGSKNSKRVIQPSPLRNHNIVQQRHVEHKINPSQITPETSIENIKMTETKDSKRVIQPSPLRTHNMVQKRQTERKSIPPKYPASVVNDHTPSTTSTIKGKFKTVKQSGMTTSSQKAHVKPLKS